MYYYLLLETFNSSTRLIPRKSNCFSFLLEHVDSNFINVTSSQLLSA